MINLKDFHTCKYFISTSLIVWLFIAYSYNKCTSFKQIKNLGIVLHISSCFDKTLKNKIKTFKILPSLTVFPKQSTLNCAYLSGVKFLLRKLLYAAISALVLEEPEHI